VIDVIDILRCLAELDIYRHSKTSTVAKLGRSSKHPVKAVYILILEQVAQTQLPRAEHENKALDPT